MIVCFAAFAAVAARVAGAVLPPGFVAEVLATNINAATAIAAAPDGRIFIAEQTGRLLVWKDGQVLEKPALILNVTDYWERGLIGMALHPEFARVPDVFVVYVTERPFVHHVISRFTFRGDEIDPSSERILLEGDNQATLGGSVPAGHQGGITRVGPDQRLYIGLGEQTAGEPSQRLNTLQGKILRIDLDGSIPSGNPFHAIATGKYRSIFAHGIRNPYGIAVQPETGRIFFTDVGGSAFEEVNELVPGANYGWPRAEGFSTNAAFKQPLYAYPPAIGQCIAGGAFVRRDSGWPERWRGKFLFADYMKNWIKALDPDAPTNVITFAQGLQGPVAMEFAPDGSLLVLNRAALWRDPKKFVANAGSLARVRYTGVVSAPPAAPGAAALGLPLDADALPRKLSRTEVIQWVKNQNVDSRLLEYEPNVPIWEPGVTVRHAVSVPNGSRMSYSETNDWHLPSGTVVLRHFSAVQAGGGLQNLETRVFVAGHPCSYGASYRWLPDSSDAVLVEDAEQVDLTDWGSRHKRAWLFPGVEACIQQPTMSVFFAPMMSARQLNAPGATNPVVELARRGMLDGAPSPAALARLPRLMHWNDSAAPVELRVRSYVDVNCAVCHQPGGASRGVYDGRFYTPLDQGGIVNGMLAAGDLGIAGARVVVPGEPERSILYRRLHATDATRMPPFHYHQEQPPILPLVEQWIRSIPK